MSERPLCHNCRGTGVEWVQSEFPLPCRRCDGTGKTPDAE